MVAQSSAFIIIGLHWMGLDVLVRGILERTCMPHKWPAICTSRVGEHTLESWSGKVQKRAVGGGDCAVCALWACWRRTRGEEKKLGV